MQLLLKNSNSRENLFSDLAYFMSNNDFDLFCRTDYSFRLVQQGSDFWIIHPKADQNNLQDASSADAHKLDINLITEALESRQFVIVASNAPVLKHTDLLNNLVYLACSKTLDNKAIDLKSSNFVSLDSAMAVMMVVAKVEGLDCAVSYTDPLFLTLGSVVHDTDTLKVRDVYEYPSSLSISLIQPTVMNAHLVGDTILASSDFSISVLPEFSEAEAENFLHNQCKVKSNMNYSIKGRELKVHYTDFGYLNITFDFGFPSKLKAEQNALEFLVRGVKGSSL